MRIERLAGKFSVCRVADFSQTDLEAEFCFISKTDQERSLVCLTALVPSNTTAREDGWRAMRIQGELDFSLVGILSRLLTLLAGQGISVFAISTYNTDYILTKDEHYPSALEILAAAGYTLI